MIVDHLKNAHLYYGLGPRFEKAFRYLKDTDLAKLETGKHAIDGDDLFIIIKRYNSFPVADCKLEAHHNYADIQHVISGKEWFAYAPLSSLTEIAAHPDKDAYYYKGNCEPLTLTGDLFALVLPDDGHMPERAINEKPEAIVKAIVKVRL